MALLQFEQVRDGLLADPSIFPQKLDFAREAMLFLRLDRTTFQAASFLDDRILTAQSLGRWVRFGEMAPWMTDAAPSRPLHFIFHSGHVGSTLVSRLIEEAAPGVLSLREPLTLRALADANDDLGALLSPAELDRQTSWQLFFWSRGYADTKAVILKATSTAARFAPTLLATRTDARALYLNLAAEPYLATLLAGENTPVDLNTAGPERMRRFERLAGPALTPLTAMSLGEIAALTWATEALTQRAAQDAFGARILPLDFDAFLRAPGENVRRICAHFSLDAPEALFARVTESPVLQHYSKAPEHPYTPLLREQILAQSRANNADEIKKGLAWLDAAAKRAPALAALLSA